METINKSLSLLLSMVDDISTIQDTSELFFKIFTKLSELYGIKMLGFGIINESEEEIAYIVTKFEKELATEDLLVWLKILAIKDNPFKVNSQEAKIYEVSVKHFIDLQGVKKDQVSFKKVSDELNITYFDFLPMKTAGKLLGYLIFSKEEYGDYEVNADYSLMISNLIGSLIAKSELYNQIQEKEKEKEIQVNLFSDLVEVKKKEIFYLKLSQHISKLIPCEYLTVIAEKKDLKIFNAFSFVRNNHNKFTPIPHSRNTITSVFFKVNEQFSEYQNYKVISGENMDGLCQQFPYIKNLKEKYNINSLLILQYSYKNIGDLSLIIGRTKSITENELKDRVELLINKNVEAFFTIKEINLGLNVLPHLGLILSNLYAFEEIQNLTNKLEQEKFFLLEEINFTNSFQEIVGNSIQIQNTLNKVKQVAPLDVTVLIQGETGTGKELIAKAVHNLSSRKENAFITVNCAALPAQLIESELFGHEKGSFTSAIEKRIGKFEVANGGTIFLDEIGELPLEIQAKLLRVLQEKEFERLGGKSTIHSNVRIVAATNRNLENEVAQGKFRSDLFFRLNVFPITIPPLRERIDDIPILVKHFINKISKKIGREVKDIRKNDLEALLKYNWPGNIRELEHLVERSMITSEGSFLNFESLVSGLLPPKAFNPKSFKTLIEMEKEYIISALKICNGKVSGENSASHLLGLNSKTLDSKMRKFSIRKKIAY